MSGEERMLLVDASAFIILAEVGACDLLYSLDRAVLVPGPVSDEIVDDPAASELERASDEGDLLVPYSRPIRDPHVESYQRAAEHLGREMPSVEEYAADNPDPDWSGDVALLADALNRYDDGVVVTDDKPLRKTCKALSIPVSGSIGVLIRAVERGELTANEAKENLYAMDEVGARLSASLVRRAARLIDDAARTD